MMTLTYPLIHMEYRRRGFGTEAFQCLATMFRTEYQWPVVRAWVALEDEIGYAFVQRLGFHIAEKKLAHLAGGIQEIARLEYSL